ncbi:hypothetical protein [Nonomuraea sp. NPDC049709]|uniref:hypothetical protein n=1 Tax=Nonomuraea sp. NPDC049709 TaxID=3154736 RepID=UPI00343A2ACD
MGVFVARYLRLRELQREIQEGLNVVERAARTNFVIVVGAGARPPWQDGAHQVRAKALRQVVGRAFLV